MASDILQRRHADFIDRPSNRSGSLELFLKLAHAVASLKLTVVLMALAIILVLAGTLAQIDRDVYYVLKDYFRTPLAMIELRIFFPRDVSVPDIKFPFPGGFLIGGAMLTNLMAAHLLRFKIQATGTRLVAGIAAIAAGVGLTWVVVASGSSDGGLQDVPIFAWSTLWLAIKLSLGVLWAGLIYAIVTLDSTRRVERVGISIGAALLGGLLAWLLYRNDFTLSDPALRVIWQLLKGLLAAVVLLGGCVLLFRKRAGIVLLHAGIALIMFNELVVYFLHTEASLRMNEGQTVSYAFDQHSTELAVVDPADPREDDVTVVPGSLLKAGKTIRDKQLPFDIEVSEVFQNADLRPLQAGDKNPADAGTGLKYIAVERPQSNGVEMDKGGDFPAAYLRLYDKQHGNKLLGTYLVSVLQALQEMPELVKVDGHEYELSLRFTRHYKPYSMHLVDGRFDKYMGSDQPRNYSSQLQLVDPTRHVDRDVHIKMNDPLRYSGETFYQTNMQTDRAGHEISTLNVVANSGWLIPYVGCMIVGTGMFAQFSIVLLRFLNRRRAASTGPVRSTSILDRALPITVAALALVFLAMLVYQRPLPEEAFDYNAFGRLPVVYDGRMKPFDTLARNSLRVISDSETFVNGSGDRQPAVRWLLDVIADQKAAEADRVFRIQNLEVIDTLGLKPREHYRYAIEEFRPGLAKLDKQIKTALDTPAEERSVFQNKTLELASRLRMYSLLSTSFDMPKIRRDHAAEDVLAAVREQEAAAEFTLPLSVPPDESSGEWLTYPAAWTKAYAQAMVLNREFPQAPQDLAEIFAAYFNHNAKEFNSAVATYQEWLAGNTPQSYDAQKLGFEVRYNHARLFLWLSWFYVAAFVLAALGWLGYARPLNRAAFTLLVLTLLVHTAAIIGRIYISGRPPVTSLYTAALFIGWGGVLLCLVLEAVYRLGIGNIVAGVAGFATLVIADRIAADGKDTITVLQAVLDTQFWLATHVTCVTMGYATTFVAGLLGILYLLGGVFNPSLTEEQRTTLPRMIYGVVCFSIFFSFVGTVLGGLWADDSWGRFWGWDPKENGALIIVLWNALVLHARWDGMIKARGLAALAVLGNIAVAWSAFGVNQLSVGLHAYGHAEGVTTALIVFALSQIAIAGLALLPARFWRCPQAASA